MTVKTSTAPELTAEQVERMLVQPLEEASKFLASGPRIINSAGPVRVPKLNGMVEPGTTTPDEPDWIGESELITEKDVDFGEVSLLPSTMKSIKVITRFSNEMARQAVVALDATLQQRLVADVAARLDAQLFSATGDGVTTPKGILAYAGVQSMDLAGAAATLDDLTDAWGLALSADVNMSGLKWVMRPETFIALRKVKEATGSNRPILQPDVTQDSLFRLFGSPVTVTKRLPLDVESQKSIVLADFSQIAVARDLAPSVTVLKERYADYDEVGIRVVTRYDAAPLNPESIVKIVNVL
ncbi:capsid protein [Nocardioides sp. Soil797]|nr:capsid protein [Nocardioides sp. Soil797]